MANRKLKPLAQFMVALSMIACWSIAWTDPGARALLSNLETVNNDISPGLINNPSGFFYDPSHDGEGFVIEALSEELANVYWFTYDGEGNQRWFTGLGKLDLTGVRVDEWYTSRGARFGDQFDPDDVELRLAGRASFQFHGCNAMSVDYTIDDIDGSQNLIRLTHVAGLDCSGVQSHRSGLSGSFYDPARNGEGVVVQVVDRDQAVAVYFTYDSEGEQMWVLGTGRISGSELELDAPFRTSGGRFGADYDAADIITHPWGALSLRLGCDQARINYQPLDEQLGEGSSSMQRLTRLAGLDCDPGTTFELPELRCSEYQRLQLTAARLSNFAVQAVVPNEEFTPAQNCSPALQPFSGSLQFDLESIFVDGDVEAGQLKFPAVKVDFISVQDFLVPLQAGLLRGLSGSYWEIVFSTGRIWSEAQDDGRSRAAVPFTMSHRQWNQAHHGLMTFLYDGDSISRVYFQVTQENLPWAANVNFRGVLKPEYQPGFFSEAHDVERAWRRDMAMRLPVRPLSELAVEAGASTLLNFNRGVPEDRISQAGIAPDGFLYLQPAFTRTGDHPYPEEMRHGAFSVSKTAGAALAMLRLAEKYGEPVFDELIRNHIDVTADHNGWDTVTFGDTLSMATGIGDAYPDRFYPVTFADEGDESNPHHQAFNYSNYMAGRLKGAFSFGNYPWGPGEVMRYNSAHTMILAVAMDNFLKSREGPQADLWEMLNQEVFQPIGIRWLPSMRLRIDPFTPGPVPLGWGLLPSAHDIVRIAELFHNEGRFEATQLLHKNRTAQLMRHNREPALPTSERTQLNTGQWVATYYRDATWSSTVGPANACNLIASRMEGLGGNFVVMMPSGMTLFRFADANVYDAGGLVITGERIAPSCDH